MAFDEALAQAFALTNRVAVVTGAASGIGRETALVLAQAGARVVLADVDRAGLDDTAARIPGALVRPTDVARQEAVAALADAASAAGPLGVWVNAAGVSHNDTVLDTAEADLDRLLAINLKGTFWGVQAAARAMAVHGRGSIINLASVAADMPTPGFSVYGITKGGVNMLTRTAAAEFGPAGIRVNSVAPGYVDTPMVAHTYRRPDGSVDEEKSADMRRRRSEGTPLGIVGQPRDIALAILYLASDASRFMTGQVLRPNGGTAMP